MCVTLKNKEIVLISYPQQTITHHNFQVREEESTFTVKSNSNDVLLQTLVISVDPYMRLLMTSAKSHPIVTPYSLGQPIRALSVSRVVASEKPGIEKDDLVCVMSNAAEYVLVPGGEGITKIDTSIPVPPSYFIGILGIPGFTAWIGIELLGKAVKGEQVYVSAAAGAVGIVVGQLAKIKGCRVVGSVGSDEKVKYLKEELGFDDAFNYKKEQDWDAALSRCFPDGIDIYFENVGGRMLEDVLNHMNNNGRIPVSGMISQYEKVRGEEYGVRNLFKLVEKNIRMEGFLVMKYFDKMPQFIQEVSSYIKDGKIKPKEHIVNGFENLPHAFIGLLKGDNIGKALVHVADF